MPAKIDNRQAKDQCTPGKKFVEQMRKIKKDRLRTVDVRSDFAEAREKFADDDPFIESRNE